MYTSKENILAKVSEYKTIENYSHENLEKLLDKEIITKLEYHDFNNHISMSLLYNSYGCYLRVWQNDILEINQIKLVA